MRINVHKIIYGFSFIFFIPTASNAADILGNLTEVGIPGQFEMQIGGGKSSQLSLDYKSSTVITQIGTATASQRLPASSDKFKENQAFLGISYTLSSRTQMFASFGNGKETSQQSSSRGIGVKISPETESPIRMGILLRAQQVEMNIDGPFSIASPYNTVNDGTNITNWWGPINGSEKIKYTRFDAFLGASRNRGFIRPYGGLCLTQISGTDTLALDDMVSTWSYPVAGGLGTYAIQHAALNTTANISGSGFVSAVFGVSITQDESALGMTAEVQAGVQNSISLSGNLKF